MVEISGVANKREQWRGEARIPRHTHRVAYAALVLSGGYEECGSRGRFHVGPGNVLLHSAFDAHLDRFGRSGAEILNIALPADTDFESGLGYVADADAIVFLAEKNIREAGEALCWQVAPYDANARDWVDILANDLLSDPDCRLGDWADVHGLAPETISRGFARVFGITPAAFRNQVRARRAFALIANSKTSLAAVAAETGFADQAHMSRAIRALTGAPPGSWRTSNPFKTVRARVA